MQHQNFDTFLNCALADLLPVSEFVHQHLYWVLVHTLF